MAAAQEVASNATSSYGPTPAMNDTYFTLDIKTTNTSHAMILEHGILHNRVENSDSKITSISAIHVTRWDSDQKECFEYSADGLSEPGFIGNSMTLMSSQMAHESHTCRTYNNDKGYFTIAEVIEAIVDLERVDRPQSEWCGGVNCNHIYFEGLLPGKQKWTDATFYIVYGDLCP
ncbi:Activating signal cointegrator 1 complex subunit [Pseudoscourfieldia marina]